jgi:hypothetical protein
LADQASGSVVLGAHLRVGVPNTGPEDPYSLDARFESLWRIAVHSGIRNPLPRILILKQPGADQDTVEKRRQDRLAWEIAAKKHGASLVFLYDDLFVPGEPPTLAWNRLYFHAFTMLGAGHFVYVDPGIPSWPDAGVRARAEENLGHLVEAAQRAHLTLGDYRPVPCDKPHLDPWLDKDARGKIAIEEGVVALLSARFPEVGRLIRALKLVRPRSEFHAVSSSLYRECCKLRGTLPYDFGLQMLVVAVARKLTVARFDVGIVPETGEYSAEKMVSQLRRVAFQMDQLHDLLLA